MQINLRKANALQNEIKTALGSLDIVSQVKITEFEEPADVIAAARTRNESTRDKWIGLNEALFEIRKSIGTANVESGISDALADISMMDSTISMMRSHSSANAV